jgi:flavin-dependent dehydrogenase
VGSGIVHGMIGGHYAANATIASIREGMTNSQLMEEYERMMRQSDIVKAPFCYHRHIRARYGTYRKWLEQSGCIKD